MSSNSSTTIDFTVQFQLASQYLSLSLGLFLFITGIVDFTLSSQVWCKLRTVILNTISLSSFTIICLQSLDIFFCTSRSIVMRQKSSVKWARLLLVACGLVWIVHEISTMIFQDLVKAGSTYSCINTNTIYASYRSYFVVPILTVTIPMLMISILAFHIYRHLHVLTQGEQRSFSILTKQLTKMALFQIGSVLLFQAPYGISSIYSLATTYVAKTTYRQAQEKLISNFFGIYVYGIYASPFYCYCLASKRFRNQVLCVINKIRCNKQRNQVLPIMQDIIKPAGRPQTTTI
ncbi:unnamed protein product [Adineta steineri]|uniref:G-protein coupled receptors family 1 profile domain-containing protein n=1 Tax=Adineta steineri TaxID=433720 RepID=A0A819E927_9BILA|nr:unnamed protein product [Adineta steineri]